MFVKTLSGELIELSGDITPTSTDEEVLCALGKEVCTHSYPRYVAKLVRDSPDDKNEEDKNDDILGMLVWVEAPAQLGLSDPAVRRDVVHGMRSSTFINDDMIRSILDTETDADHTEWTNLFSKPHPLIVDRIVQRMDLLDYYTRPRHFDEFLEVVGNPDDRVVHHPHFTELITFYARDFGSPKRELCYFASVMSHLSSNRNPRAIEILWPYFLATPHIISVHRACSIPSSSIIQRLLNMVGVEQVVECLPYNEKFEYGLQLHRDNVWRLKVSDLHAISKIATDPVIVDYAILCWDMYMESLVCNPCDRVVDAVMERIDEVVEKGKENKHLLHRLSLNSSDRVVTYLLAHPEHIRFPEFVCNANTHITELQIDYFQTVYRDGDMQEVLWKVQNEHTMEWLLNHIHEWLNERWWSKRSDKVRFLGRFQHVKVV